MFFEEFAKTANIELKNVRFLANMLDFYSISLEGRFKIEFFSQTKIILSFAKQKVFVYGQNLQIKNLDKTELMITGNLLCVSSREVTLV